MRYGLAATALPVFSFGLQAVLFLAALFICLFDYRPWNAKLGIIGTVKKIPGVHE